MYDEFRDCENATIRITKVGSVALDDNYQPVESEIEIYNDSGIFYELSATEKASRDQIQKSATGQVILGGSKNITITYPTTLPVILPFTLDTTETVETISDTMTLYVTNTEVTDKKYRIVTANNPLQMDEAVIIDIIEN